MSAVPLTSKVVSIVVISLAAIIAVSINNFSKTHPSSDDATIDAEIIHIASPVSGRVVELLVKENEKVKKGDLLYRLDPETYTLAIEQAQANLEISLAALDTKRRMITSETLTAKVAEQQKNRAETNLQLSRRTTERLKPLAGKAYIPEQQFDQAQTAQSDAVTSLQQAKNQLAIAERNIGNERAASATIRANQAALDLARKALRDSEVYAPKDGRIVGLSIEEGEMVAPNQSLFTLISVEEWHAVANFRESELAHMHEGDCATVYSMIDRTRPIHGMIDGLGWGVMDTDRINLPRVVPLVEKSLNWVRVAQRFPVRIKLESPPEELARLGASAVVEIKHGQACKN